MKAYAEKHKCRYCQIDLVDIQQLTASSIQSTRVENIQAASAVIKCPVCGYSELGKPSLVKNYIRTKIAVIGHQTPAT